MRGHDAAPRAQWRATEDAARADSYERAEAGARENALLCALALKRADRSQPQMAAGLWGVEALMSGSPRWGNTS